MPGAAYGASEDNPNMTSAIGHTLSHWHIVIAWTIFLASYLVFAIGRLPGTKIDRPAMAIIGAVLMFVFGVLSPKPAVESIDFATIVLLFAMMLIVATFTSPDFSNGSRSWPSSTSVLLNCCPASSSSVEFFRPSW